MEESGGTGHRPVLAGPRRMLSHSTDLPARPLHTGACHTHTPCLASPSWRLFFTCVALLTWLDAVHVTPWLDGRD